MSILFFVLWIILNGRVTLELAILGILIATAVSAFAWSVMGYSPVFELKIMKNLPVILLYVLNLIREVALAAWAVMQTIYSGAKPDPVIVEFHSGFNSRTKNVLLANSITLTPGTYTLYQKGDLFVVHCLRREFAEGMDDSSFVHLLRRLEWK